MTMFVFYQFIAVGLTFLITYIFFRGFGQRSNSLLYSRSEKASWDANLRGSLGKWLVASSVCGTLTSFASFMFLTGSVKLFGWFSAATALTIIISAWVTNYLTRPVRNNPRVDRLLTQNDQVTGVIASLFWGETRDQKSLALMLKYVSLASILAIIWLEFTAFVDLTAFIHGIDNNISAIMMAVMVFSVVYFVLRYGIRGFVFADLLHAPLIGVAVVVLAIFLVYSHWPISGHEVRTITLPILSTSQCILFAIHVLFLNVLQVVCSEPHWFRIWLLRDQEITQQPLGAGLTGALWLVMLPIGFFAYDILVQQVGADNARVGEPAIAALVATFGERSSIFLTLFWSAATAALFSTTDMQIYSALLVSRFDTKEGRIRDLQMSVFQARVGSAIIATTFAIIYWVVKASGIHLEKILFVIVPFGITLIPAFIHYRFGKEPRAWVIALSALLYIGVAAIGFMREDLNFYFTLSAVFVPVFIALATAPLMSRSL